MLIFPLLYLSPCNCTGFLSLPPAGLFPLSTVSPEQKANLLTFPLPHEQAHTVPVQEELASLCSPPKSGVSMALASP